MDWTERFEHLAAPHRLLIAAVLAERTLPLAGGITALADGLRLVGLQIEGRATKKLELTRLLNAAIEAAQLHSDDSSARALAARAVFDVLETALHNSDAASSSIDAALAAVKAHDERAFAQEIVWLDWAISAAEREGRPRRAVLFTADAPTRDWSATLSSANLPLFGPHG